MSFGINFILYVPPLMYKINTRNWLTVCNGQIIYVQLSKNSGCHPSLFSQIGSNLIIQNKFIKTTEVPFFFMRLHTYIIGHWQLALILYVSGGTYSLTSTPNDKFLRNFFMADLFTLRVFARNLLIWEEIAEEIFFIFHFWWLTWDTNPGRHTMY